MRSFLPTSLLAAFLALLSVQGFGAPAGLSPVLGKDLYTEQPRSIPSGPKGTVVLFLSIRCPCSSSHVPEIKKLALDYPDFAFVGVHSNGNEPATDARAYFRYAGLSFPILSDQKFALADSFRALKTPHAFVLDPAGKILYQGGVTSSNDASRADTHFLREVLSDLQAGKAPRRDRGRTLGCVISRGDS